MVRTRNFRAKVKRDIRRRVFRMKTFIGDLLFYGVYVLVVLLPLGIVRVVSAATGAALELLRGGK